MAHNRQAVPVWCVPSCLSRSLRHSGLPSVLSTTRIPSVSLESAQMAPSLRYYPGSLSESMITYIIFLTLRLPHASGLTVGRFDEIISHIYMISNIVSAAEGDDETDLWSSTSHFLIVIFYQSNHLLQSPRTTICSPSPSS